jgi:endoglucanase
MNSTKYLKLTASIIAAGIISIISAASERDCLTINDSDYFEMDGLNVIVFDDSYPEGHQGGITIIQNGVRVAANGDLRLETAPGQWQPLPKTEKKVIDTADNSVAVTLYFPDEERSRQHFNPLPSPDIKLRYHVKVKAECESVRITVDLDEPIPERWIGKVGFNLELFPGTLFDNAYYMDDKAGFFPRQLNGPLLRDDKEILHIESLAEGKSLTIAPETADRRMTITAIHGKLKLLDGRALHNNGWFIVRTDISPGATRNAVEWLIKADAVPGWIYDPVIHISQAGYHPLQPKVAVIECDKRHVSTQKVYLKRIMENGDKITVFEGLPESWGEFLRYQYLRFDFSAVEQSGLYILEYENSESGTFRVDRGIFDRHVWQPTLEYFLPVQMCHMRINDRYRVWHGLCHMDDALMAPVDTIHLDGYFQGDSTLTHFRPYEHVPGLNAGGWHDAGDYDLRVESQSGTVHMLSLTYEEFGIDYDVTTVDQKKHLVELHVPDGKPDVLQQIEHGVISILGGYKNLGRLYRGIISSTTRQYVLLGDGANMTDNDISLPSDNRWVFTEINPRRELYVSGCLAAASRVLKGYNDTLSLQCLQVAEELWEKNRGSDRYMVFAAEALAELIITTDKQVYKKQLLEMSARIPMSAAGWSISRVVPLIDDKQFGTLVNDSLRDYLVRVRNELDESPFGVLYRPRIWGAGWHIQSIGIRQYYLYRYMHDDAFKEYMLNTLNFVLGCHPGENTASFVSGVGTNSSIVAYGVNRADWSYIPGGVISGTALIRPDFPELKVWPYLWQQTEYVIGGGATKFMFLVLAARHILEEE